jgi:hypothetical protein
MNNLTPLQALTAQIYCAKLNATTEGSTESTSYFREPDYDSEKLLNEAITEAKALLEATKPEPLEWKDATIKGYANPIHYSNGNEFQIAQTNGGIFTVSLTKDLERALGNFPTLDEAKQFAEFIRTR